MSYRNLYKRRNFPREGTDRVRTFKNNGEGLEEERNEVPWPYHYVLLSADSRSHKLPRRGLLFVLIKKEIKKDDFCIFYMVYFTMFYASLAVYGFSQIPKIVIFSIMPFGRYVDEFTMTRLKYSK